MNLRSLKIFSIGAAIMIVSAVSLNAKVYDVTRYGAKGNGTAIDSPAINKAISAAAANGGGTVYVPAGTYACYSIRLASHIHLYLEKGAVILAAEPTEKTGYDLPEPNPDNKFQDFGHSHWQNSLIWGMGLEDVTISGEGTIDGKGLERKKCADLHANKGIAMKLCNNVSIRDIKMYRCGHFAMLLTGVENLVIQNVTCDTQRDGFDIDCCRNVRVTGCSVNSPYDDGIVLKSSYALGRFKDTENVTISDCFLSGYDVGSLIHNTWSKEIVAKRKDNSCGRIKLGTETSGGFKNVAVTNCVFEYCGGLFVECMDGGVVEDVTFNNITMRDCLDSPIFIRLGARMRSPEGTPLGQLRRILFSDINVYNANSTYPAIISGIPGHCVEDIVLRNVYLNYKGGSTADPSKGLPPEAEKGYPDPWMFGPVSCKGMLLRHARRVTFDGVHYSFNTADQLPLMLQDDVKDFVERDVTVRNIYEETEEDQQLTANEKDVLSPLSSDMIYSIGALKSSTSVMQSFDLDLEENIIYYTQLHKRYQILASWGKVNGLESDGCMYLDYFGHGSNFTMENLEKDKYLWIGTYASKNNKGDYWGDQIITRIKIEDGKEIKPWDCTDNYYFGEKNISCAVDFDNDEFTVLGISSGNVRTYKLSEMMALPLAEITLEPVTYGGDKAPDPETTITPVVKARDCTVLKPMESFHIDRVEGVPWQGFDVCGKHIFQAQGKGNGNDGITPSQGYVLIYKLKGSVVQSATQVMSIADIQALKELGITDTGYMEPEGIKIRNGKMYCGYASKNSEGVKKGVILMFSKEALSKGDY